MSNARILTTTRRLNILIEWIERGLPATLEKNNRRVLLVADLRNGKQKLAMILTKPEVAPMAPLAKNLSDAMRRAYRYRWLRKAAL
jgi:hypothetical protein